MMKDREAWHGAVHGITNSWTWLSNWKTTTICDIIWYLSLSFWLTSLNMIISRSIHVATNDKISFFFLWLQWTCLHALGCPALCDPMAYNWPGSSVRNFPGENTGVGCHFLLLWVFPTQGSKWCLLCLLHWHANYLPLCHLRSPKGSGGCINWKIGTDI